MADLLHSHRPDYNVPDRLLALSSVRELSQRRKWHLILVNVEPAEAAREREEHFRHLVHPLRSVLDDSIGCALWFAARGEGLLQCDGPVEGKSKTSNPVPCVSSAKVSRLATCTVHTLEPVTCVILYISLQLQYEHSFVALSLA